jgi:hypothetical protein
LPGRFALCRVHSEAARPVSDMLDYGRDREPRWRPGWPWGGNGRRWRWLAIIGACLVVVIAAAVVWSVPGLRHHGGHPRPGAQGPVAGGPPSGEVAQGGPAVDSPPPTRPALMTGQSLPPAAGLRLLLGGQSPAWLAVAADRTERIRGLPRSGTDYQLIRIAGGWAAQLFPPDTTGCDSCAPAPLPVYFIADGSPAARRIGAASVIAPAAAPGALWLAGYQPGANMNAAAGTAREVSVTGAALGPRITLPAGYAIDQGTRAGLLLVREQLGPGPDDYELWDPGTRRVTRAFPNLIAANPTEIAWTPSCAGECGGVRVLDLPSGRTRDMALPGRGTAAEGEFSPDGGLLALLVTNDSAMGGPATENQLMVATVASGRVTAVPGTTVGSGIALDFGWEPGSQLLIADVTADAQGQSLEQGGEWQIGVWRPGAAQLSTTFARTPYQSWPVVDLGPY